MSRIVRHLWDAIRHENTQAFDARVRQRAARSAATGDMLPWYTGRPWADTRALPREPLRAGQHVGGQRGVPPGPPSPAWPPWVKNDRLGFEIVYVWDGVVRVYRPDFLVRLTSGPVLVLEVKGQDSPRDPAKRDALDEWTRAVTGHGGFGRWTWAVLHARRRTWRETSSVQAKPQQP